MSQSARDLLVRGIASAKADEPDLARRYLERCLRMGPSTRQRVDALFWLARVSSTEPERIDYLQQVLNLEPTNFAARRDLALLRGELEEEELVDPTAPQRPSAPAQTPIQERRYVCTQCGGRMEYDPRNHRLTCRYCGHRSHLAEVLSGGAAVAEEDFIQALATAKGHTLPQSTPTFQCEACGASYLLEPDTLSLTCAHCSSTYVIDRSSSQELVPPQGIVPFAIDEDHAEKRVREWLEDHEVEGVQRLGELRGFYLPAWTFDLTGEAPYTYQRREGDEWVTERGSRLVIYDDLPVPASHRLPKHFSKAVHDFDLTNMVPFDGSRLAGWPAEIYEISATDAAMAARWYAVEQARRKAKSTLYGRVKDFRMSSTDLLVAAYRLILLPIWLTEYVVESTRYQVTVNGQSGAVRGEQPARGLGGFLRRLLGGGDLN